MDHNTKLSSVFIRSKIQVPGTVLLSKPIMHDGYVGPHHDNG
jgi:hypothetical protein